VAGTFIGSVGVGGVLLIPALMVFAGLNIHEASATALFTFFFTGLLATYLFKRRGSINWRMSAIVGLGALFTSYLGAWLNSLTHDAILSTIIGALVVLAGVWALRTQSNHSKTNLAASGVEDQKRFIALLCVGVAAGFGSGLSGAGGPLFSVPLMLALKFNPLLSIGVAQILQIVAASSGSIANFQHQLIRIDVVLFILIFELIGIAIGVVIAHRANLNALRKAAAWLCIVVGVYMVIKLL